MPELDVRRARQEDLDVVVALQEEATAWVRSLGIDPGVPPRPLRDILAESIAAGRTYLARVGGAAAGELTLTEHDPVWEDVPGDALYVHGLMVGRAFAGQGVGLALLRWAEGQAVARGKAFVRLDCNADNPRLRAYYRRAGFAERGEVTLPHRVAARYEREAHAEPVSDADLLTEAENWIWFPPGTRLDDDERTMIMRWPDPARSVVRWTHAPDADAATLIAEVLARLKRQGRTGARWWVSPLSQPADLEGALRAHGFELVETVNLLTWDMGDGIEPHLPALNAPETVAIDLVSDVEGLRQIHAVDAAVWGDPLPTEEELALEVERLRAEEAKGTRAEFYYLARIDGQPVASAGYTLVGRVARFWGASTLTEARGKGAYRALVAVRARDAFTHGARAILTKAKDETSSPILLRAGFRTLGQERCYYLRWGE